MVFCKKPILEVVMLEEDENEVGEEDSSESESDSDSSDIVDHDSGASGKRICYECVFLDLTLCFSFCRRAFAFAC
jgi:hypothetical protein